MYLFDVYIAVDFSGSKSRVQQMHGIAIAENERGAHSRVQTDTFTRKEVVSYLLERIIHHNANGKRVLCGFDFQYSFPKGFWSALTGLPETWTNILQGMVEGVADLPPITEEPESNARKWANNANQRIALLLQTKAGPFWGPHFFQGTDPKFSFSHASFEEFRLVEKRIKGCKPIFKIGGLGTVGLQSLCGMPYLPHIRTVCLERHIRLHCWPFDGWRPQGSAHSLVEWYPAIQNQGQKSHGNDALACVEWARDMDDQGRLSTYFVPRLSKPEKAQAALEGWVLGII